MRRTRNHNRHLRLRASRSLAVAKPGPKKSASANFWKRSVNPPVPRRQRSSPRRREVQPKIFPRLPRLTTAPPPLPEALEVRTPTPPPSPIESAPKRSTTEPDFEVREVARQTSSEPLAETRRAGLARFKLGTPQDLRTAIVLREIFGPPRSLQPFDTLT